MHKRLRRHVEECLGPDQQLPLAWRRLLRRIEREYRRGDRLRASLRHALGLLSSFMQAPRRSRRAPPERIVTAPSHPPPAQAPERAASGAPPQQWPSAALLCDGDQRVTSWSPAAEARLAIPAADAMGCDLAMLLYPGDSFEEAKARTALRQAFVASGTRRLALLRRSPEDGAPALDLILVPLAAADGAECGCAGLLLEREDIAEDLSSVAPSGDAALPAAEPAADDEAATTAPPEPAPPGIADDLEDASPNHGSPDFAALQRALERAELRVEYLPVVDLATGQVQALEALLRWAHPEQGLLVAAQFMRCAEETGLIVPIGRWLMREAARDFRRCKPFAKGLKLHLNLSPRQLEDPELIADLEGVLDDRGLRAESLILEVAESVLQAPELGRRVAELHARGFGISVDDFGSGGCTLESLFRVPFDSLKIDRALLAAEGSGQPAKLLRCVVKLARECKAQAIAKGVETEAQLALLRELRCPAAQGFSLSRPVDVTEARALLARSTCLARSA